MNGTLKTVEDFKDAKGIIIDMVDTLKSAAQRDVELALLTVLLNDSFEYKDIVSRMLLHCDASDELHYGAENLPLGGTSRADTQVTEGQDNPTCDIASARSAQVVDGKDNPTFDIASARGGSVGCVDGNADCGVAGAHTGRRSEGKQSEKSMDTAARNVYRDNNPVEVDWKDGMVDSAMWDAVQGSDKLQR